MSEHLEHKTLVTPNQKITTSTYVTDSGKATSQTIKTTDLKTGKVSVDRVSGGRLIP